MAHPKITHSAYLILILEYRAGCFVAKRLGAYSCPPASLTCMGGEVPILLHSSVDDTFQEARDALMEYVRKDYFLTKLLPLGDDHTYDDHETYYTTVRNTGDLLTFLREVDHTKDMEPNERVQTVGGKATDFLKTLLK